MTSAPQRCDSMAEVLAELGGQGVRIVGIVGGVASGKTAVRKAFEGLGAGVLDGDVSAHQVLGEEDVKQAIRRRWGEGVFNQAGEVDRGQVAKIVFAPGPQAAAELRFLEDLTHPRISVRLCNEARRLAAEGTRLIVLDAAVMDKAGWDRLCDTLVYVDADRPTRWSRAKARGWTQRDFDARERAQESLQVRRGRADVVIDNGGSLEHTHAQVQRIVADLLD
ncbi:MAG: dephospho-CoA kinase [Planctomycetales bacterium]|nr:dephospho-CoA kinase [Planctomycetales bacterium]